MLPALDELIFNRFNRIPPQYTRVFRVMDSNRSIEQTSEIAGLGLFSEIPENSPMRYDQPVPGFSKTFTHLQYGLGFRISRIMVDDDRFALIDKMSSELGRSAKETIEIAAASTLNNGFSSSYNGPDGVPLFSASHPIVKTGAVQANLLSPALDLDQAALETMLTLFRTMKDPSGKRARVKPGQLIVPPQLEFTAAEILESSMRSDTPNNAVNALRHRDGYSPFSKWFVYDYLTDADAWFVTAAKEDTELRWYWRERPNTVHAIDFDTRAIKTAMWYRHSFGWSSYYGVAGSEGAS